MRLLGMAGILACSMTSIAQAQAGTGDVAGLASLRTRFIEAYNKGDSTSLERLYTPDAVRMPYDAPAVIGETAVVAGLRSAFRLRRLDPTLSLEAEEIHVFGDQAVERGAYHEVLRSRTSGPTISEDGKYVALLRREPDGSWRYQWSIFNRDRPPGR